MGVVQTTGMSMPAIGATHTHSDTAGGGHAGHVEVVPPARNDPRFVAGTTGPVEGKGDAPTVKIPDGKGFGGAKGRKQNGDDKKQNNYSVTDANFNNQLGLLARDPDTGGTLNYVQHTQMYNAAGYLENFAPEVYAQLVANQNAGKGTVLGAAAHIMGLVKTPDPAEQGVDVSSVPHTIPGSPISADRYVMSGKDITGQNWARMHHPESAWAMYKNIMATGQVDWKTAMVLSGDDGVSGAGRVNGVNNQNGSTGFNGGEKEIWSLGAQYGSAVIQAMMAGHNHDTGQSADALTNPKINKIIGAPKDARGLDRAEAITQVLQNGKVGNADKAGAKGAQATNADFTKGIGGAAGASHGADQIGNAAQTTAPAADAGAGADQISAGGPVETAPPVATDLGSLLQQLLELLTKLVQLLSAGPGVSQAAAGAAAATTPPALIGGGAAPVTDAIVGATAVTPAPAPAAHDAVAHAHA